ncbi:hypothetical protein BGZ51_007787 [Haplosporangium sp. Z 767]|nr:hypothetical protein BGZ51_007787 [Haplosporangium sp. Z 767]
MFGIATVTEDEVRRVHGWAELMDVEVHKAAAISLDNMTEDAHSEDLGVQQNTTAALFNLTISHDSRQALVDSEVASVLFKALTSKDIAILRSFTAALANIPISKLNLEQLKDAEIDVFHTLIHFLNVDDNVCCQAAHILTNTAEDKRNKENIVKSKGLPTLLLMSNSKSESKVRDALCCVFKLAELPENAPIVTRAGFKDQFLELLDPELNHEIPAIAITITHWPVYDDHRKATWMRKGY